MFEVVAFPFEISNKIFIRNECKWFHLNTLKMDLNCYSKLTSIQGVGQMFIHWIRECNFRQMLEREKKQQHNTTNSNSNSFLLVRHLCRWLVRILSSIEPFDWIAWPLVGYFMIEKGILLWSGSVSLCFCSKCVIISGFNAQSPIDHALKVGIRVANLNPKANYLTVQ